MKQKLYNKLTTFELSYLLFATAVYVLFALVFVTFDYGPDEYMRYDVPKFIFENGMLPCGWEESIRNEIWGMSYGFGFSLPYAIGALFMWIVSFFTVSDTALLVASRMASAFSTVAVGYYAIQITKKLTDKPSRWIFIVLMTLLPQIVFLSSYFNLDCFSLLCVTAIIFSWICCEQTDWSVSSCVHLAVWLGLCFLSYQFAYSFILCSALLYIYRSAKRHEIPEKQFWTKGVLIVAIAFAICGWVFIRNAVLYDGDFLALKAANKYQEMYAWDEFKPSQKFTFQNSGYSVFWMLTNTPWVQVTCESFVSVLGYLNIFADDWVYFFYRLLIAVSLAGIAMKLGDGKIKREDPVFMIAVFVFLSSLITVGISVYYSWAVDFQAQGRYIIALLPFFAGMISFGADGLFEALSSLLHVNKTRFNAIAAVLICIVVFITTVEGFFNCAAVFLPQFA